MLQWVCLQWVKGPPLANLWAMLKGVIPRRMGMRRIAGMMNSNLCLPNIGELYELNLTLYEATFVPGFDTLQEIRDYLRIARHSERIGSLDFPSSIELPRQFSRS
ncbi:MAG: hypothetical protein A2157_15915 [Deltaproteobacteria bacterium RBG_16_47_11]|nr:MAG: hypothetical protein A2157_15915 [Deltaproteobacteria bacterium RBG_16_47_11]